MQMFEQLKALVRNVAGKARVEQDLDEEVRAYLDMTIDEKVSRGMSRDKALREARIEMGGIEQLKEEVRAAKLGASLEKTWRDFRFALRLFARNPGFTAVIVLSLGLCIGANTAIFSLVNALLLKTLPVNEPERLVLYSDGRARGFISGQSDRWNIFSYPLYQRFREPGTSFEDVAGFRTQLDRLSLRTHGTGSGEAAQLAWGRLVSGNYFSVLGVKAALGRSLAADDERLAAVPVAVLAFDYWKRQYESSPSVVGQVIDINSVPVTIVGVAPAGFFGESVESQLADVWLPLTLQPRTMQRQSALEDAEANWLNLIGRLRPGSTMVQAQAEVSARFQQFLLELAGANLTGEQQQQLQRNYIVLTPGANGISALREQYSRALRLLMGVVGFVLLIACANVANLLLSRAAAREKEMSMRLALGAGRGRLLRQLLTESVLLTCMGGALGLLLSGWMARALVAGVSTGDRTVPLNLSPDASVLVFTAGVCILVVILFGLAPALRTSRVDLMTALKASGAAGSGRSRRGLARGFVIAQVALSLPLLAGAALLVQTLRELRTQDFGFSHENVLEVGIDPGIAGYKPDQVGTLYRAVLDRVHSVPGVRIASLSQYSPMSGDNWSGQVQVEGYTPSRGESAYCQWVWVGPRYAETLGMTLLLGRDLDRRDTENSPKVAVVNESFARRYLADQNPIGRHFSLKDTIEIVGVVKDFKFNDPRQEIWPVAFMPLVQSSFTPARFARYLEVRAGGDPLSVAANIREAVKEVAPGLPVTGMKTLSQQINTALGREDLIAGVSSSFAVLALLLACIGLYGVVSYSVAGRTKEIGVRMALGARRPNILTMVLREALLLALIGAGIGLATFLAVAEAVSSQLYGLKPTDPYIMAGASLLLIAATGLAGFIPAHRASRVDPMTTLRAE